MSMVYYIGEEMILAAFEMSGGTVKVMSLNLTRNAISLTIDPKTPEDKWSTLESSTDQNDLKKISKLCKIYLNNFNEKLENTKTSANKKLPEPNKTTEDIANLVSEIKTQVKNASVDLVTVRKLVQKTALRFRDTFKSLVSFTELENDSVNKELESIKKTAVDSKKPLVNRVIRSFGNRHSKTVNDNALKALDTFFEGMKSVKSVKKKVKTVGENALDEIKAGNDIIKLKNAVELAKALKLKFEDEWNLDSGELTYSDEQKKTNTQVLDENKSDVQENEEDTNKIENVSINDIQTGLPKTEQGAIENNKTNGIPTTQDEIEKLPMDNIQTSDKAVSSIEEIQLTSAEENMDETKTIPETENSTMDTNVSNTIYSPIKENPLINNTENKDKTVIVQPQVSNKDQNSINDDNLKPDSSGQEISFNPDSNNDAATQLTESTDNKIGKQYDPNQYILKILDDANHRSGIGGMKKTTYYKMLAVAHNLNHETQEMENAALYAMNKIHEGKIAATNLQKKFNKEKASKACYIRNILAAQENENDKKNKDENKEKVKESLNEDDNKEPLKQDVNLDSVDALQPSTINDDNEPIINNNEETKTQNEIDELINTDHDTEIPENSETEKVDSNKEHAPQEENVEESTSVKPKVKRRRKIIDPKDGKEISEEYEVSEEDENNLNKSGEKQSDENKGLDSSDNTNTEHDTETPEHSEAEPVDSNEEHAPQEGNDEESTSVKPKVKRRRKIIDPKDGKEISEEYEVSEEDENNLNKSEHAPQEGNDEESTSVKPKVKRRRKIIDPKDGKEISEEYEVSEEDENNLNKSIEKNSNTSRDLKTQPAVGYVADKDLENITRETVDLEENENLNSLDDEKMNCVYNDNIIPAAESMGEDSSSEEANNGEPNQRSFKDPNNGQEITEKYDTSEGEKDVSSVIDQNINATPLTPNVESTDHNINEPDSERPKYEESQEYKRSHENVEPSENEENSEYNHSNKQTEVNEHEPDRKSNEGLDKSKDIEEQIEGEESVEYETVEEDDNKVDKLKTLNTDSTDQFDEKPISNSIKGNIDSNEVQDVNSNEEPKYVNENNTEPEVVNDGYNDNYPVEERGVNSEPMPSDGYNVEDNIPETENGEPTEKDVDETLNNKKPRRRRNSRKPKSVNENENEPEVVNDAYNDNYPVEDQGVNSENMPSDGNNVQDTIPEIKNGEHTDNDNETEQPELTEYPENALEAPEASPENDVGETMNNGKPRRRRKSKKPRSDIVNENEPEVINDESNDNYPVEERGVNSENMPSDGNNVEDNVPETKNGEPIDNDNEIRQPELSEYPENALEAPAASPENDIGENINNGEPRPRKVRRRRKSRKPKSVKGNENIPEVVNDGSNDNYSVEDQGINSEPMPSDDYNVQDTTPVTEDVQPTEND
ncbi:myb-like protein X, partial [Myzus persicae]|uniref:myb-like protein X n=1 Tax=Myzus persicae TaxID=13164 RepID=UPI000B933B98